MFSNTTRTIYNQGSTSGTPSRSIFGRQTFMRSRLSESSPQPPGSRSPPRPSRFRIPLYRHRALATDLEANIPENSVASQSAYSQPAAGVVAPPPTVPPPAGDRRVSRRFTGSERPELRLRDDRDDNDEIREAERRMRNWMGASVSKERRRRAHGKKKKKEDKDFMFCFPPIKSELAKKHVLRSFVAGVFTVCLLAIYLGLTVTHKASQSEFSIMLIMMIFVSTMIFCHSLTRACFLILRPPPDESSGTLYNVNGYAIPQAPIPVILARDEEAQGIETANKADPPAYGQWRSSVRVDPNGMTWQQNPNALREQRPATGVARPPSYVSEDGVSYVVDAVSRSTVPGDDLLPVHPSERGRVGVPEGRQ